METLSGHIYYPKSSGGRTGGVMGVVENRIQLGLQWPNGNVVEALASTDIVESAPGSYTGARTAPVVDRATFTADELSQNGRSYVIVWFDPVLNDSTLQDLLVRSSFASTEPSYATYNEIRAHLGVTTEQMSDDDLARPLRLAQDDIDAACGAWNVYPDTGLKFASDILVNVLSLSQARLLSQATCYQVEYRMTVGDDFMVREQYEATSGPGYGTAGTIRKVMGAAYTKLHAAGLLSLTSRASNSEGRYRGTLPSASHPDAI